MCNNFQRLLMYTVFARSVRCNYYVKVWCIKVEEKWGKKTKKLNGKSLSCWLFFFLAKNILFRVLNIFGLPLKKLLENQLWSQNGNLGWPRFDYEVEADEKIKTLNARNIYFDQGFWSLQVSAPLITFHLLESGVFCDPTLLPCAVCFTIALYPD